MHPTHRRAPARFLLAILAACAAAPVALALPQQQQETRRRYDGDVVVRVRAQDLRQLRTALALTDDLWSHGAGLGSFDMRVTPAQRAAMDAAGLSYEVLIPDLQARIDAETQRLAQAQEGGGVPGGEGGVAADDWFTDFKTRAQIEARMDELVAAYPSMVSPVVVGTSFEGRTIRGIRITRTSNPLAPEFLFDACQHAREWATPMTAMYVADRLISGAATDPRIAAILDNAVVYVIPVVNPDGYEYSWSTDRLWRKNRQPNGDGTVGTDTNRNWGYQWGGEGASTVPNDATYRGTAAFSAPEAAALRDFYLARPRIKGSIDFHSYSQLAMWPWGWTSALCPADALHRAVGLAMKSALAVSSGKVYAAGPIYTTIYPASGGSVDWSYGAQGVTSYTIEVRDTGTYGFIMPAAEILPNVRENYDAAMTMMEGLLSPAIVAPVGTVPTTLVAGQPTPISVTVTPTTGVVSSVALRWRMGTGGAFLSVPMTQAGGPWTGSIPGATCGHTVQWYVEATCDTGVARLPAAAPASLYSAPAQQATILFDDTMETDKGWTVGATGDNATAGIWVRVDPVGTAAQPEDDHSTDGTRCWITGQGTVGGAVGAADVDGGTTTLVSPVLDGSDLSATLSYWRWYSNNQGSAPNADSMPVEWSRDGVTWTVLEDVSENAGTWVQKQWTLSSFLPSAGNFRIRFRARDLGSGSVVEAGVDDVRVARLGCSGSIADIDGSGVVDGADLGLLLGAWGQGSSPADLDDNGVVDGADLGILLGSWG
ncbi:MAG: M14 family zinc carboxypeptidase [Phycisphaerales bacterium]